MTISSSRYVSNSYRHRSSAPPLDCAALLKTVSTLKKWLKTKPTQEDAMTVFQHEKDTLNRNSAVGTDGCLTEYLKQ